MADITYLEDMLVLLANLVEAEWHAFFTSLKWKEKQDYWLNLLNEIRLQRIQLMKELGIDDLPDESHCTVKHLFSIFVRNEEVGTRYLKDGDVEKAKEYFKKAFIIFNTIVELVLPAYEKRNKNPENKSESKAKNILKKAIGIK